MDKQIMSFEQIYKEYYQPVYNRVFTRLRNIEVSQEITNNVFLKVDEHLKVFDPEKAKFITWLFVITDRKIIDQYRKDSKRIKANDIAEYTEQIENISSEQSTDGNIDRNDIQYRVSTAMAELKPILRNVAEMFFIKDLSHKQIAEMLDIPINSVKVYILRSREILQGKLKNEHVAMY